MAPGADTEPTADGASRTLCRENTLTATLTATENAPGGRGCTGSSAVDDDRRLTSAVEGVAGSGTTALRDRGDEERRVPAAAAGAGTPAPHHRVRIPILGRKESEEPARESA